MVSKAFAPGALGPLTLKNRFIKAATFEGVMARGEVSDALIDFHGEVARGGAAMTTVAYLAISPGGRVHRDTIVLDADRVPALRRLTEAMFQQKPPQDQPERERVDLDSRLTVSDIEVFRNRDFDGMSALELAEAKQAISRLVMPLQHVKTRRFVADPHGQRPDPRRAMRASLRAGGGRITMEQTHGLPPPHYRIVEASRSGLRHDCRT